MLRNLIRTENGLRRHLDTPLGRYLDGYLSHRHSQGFAPGTMANDLKWVTTFGEYLGRKKKVSIARLAESDLEAFVAYYRRHPQRCGPARRTPLGSVSLIASMRGSVRSLLAYLRAIAAIGPAPQSPTPYDGVLAEYLEFLRNHCGFAKLTLEQHRRCSSAFFGQLSRQRPHIDLAMLSVVDVEAAMVAVAEDLGRRSRQIMTTTIKSLLRHLRSTAQVPRACVPFLPQMKTYALSSLPSVIAWNDVERALAGVAKTTLLGRRNYAMVLLVATYGLRAAEVVDLRLDDIGWRQGVIHVRQSKTRRTLDLPLLPAVRDALVAYVRDGRGTTDDRRVFLKVHAPRGAISRAVLYHVVRTTLSSAGIEATHFGPHAIRHARATSLMRRGESLKTIGDLLGHRVPEATLIYCKVAIEDLRTVALELPEVAP